MSASHDALAKELAKTDRDAAFAVVSKTYLPRIRSEARQVMGTREAAFDLAQDVLIKAMREKRLFDPEFRIWPWLRRVTRNLAYNRVRDRKRRSALLEERGPQAAAPVDPSAAVLASEQARRVQECIERLSEAHREVLIARYYADASYKEIADRLGLKLGTVMSRLSRARSALQSVLDEDLAAVA